MNKDKNIVLYADDTSIVITDTNSGDFNLHANMLFNSTNTWFNNSLLNLNFSKTNYLEFISMKYYKINRQIHYNYISNTNQTTFLGLIIDDTLIMETTYWSID
jgi:hypothetical protein